MNHHPELRNVYGHVTIELSTHDLGGISKKDFKEGRLFECAFTCGQTFTKCWDQGGSVR